MERAAHGVWKSYSAADDAFYLMMRNELLGSQDVPQRDALPKALYEQTLDDYTLLAKTETADAGFMMVYADDGRMVFDSLVMHSTLSSLVLADAEDERAALDAALHGTARLRSVIARARRAERTPSSRDARRASRPETATGVAACVRVRVCVCVCKGVLERRRSVNCHTIRD